MNAHEIVDRREFLRSSLAAGLLAASGACASPKSGTTPADDAPTPTVEAIVLGTAQDGGIPHLGCRCEQCVATREGRLPPRTVACLGLVDREVEACWLIDATPDIRDQVGRLLDTPELEGRSARDPVSGIFVGHAHIGHYLGLAFLGRESIHARSTPVYASRQMAKHLRRNAPFELLVRLGNIEIQEVEPGERVGLGPQLAVTPFHVPHREEYTDTYAYRITGPNRTLVYISDIDEWTDDAAREVESADVALLDATFFSMDELPGRPRSEIPHPPMQETIQRFAPIADRTRIIFTHLNHSNPAVDPESDEARLVEKAGFEIAREGMSIPL